MITCIYINLKIITTRFQETDSIFNKQLKYYIISQYFVIIANKYKTFMTKSFYRAIAISSSWQDNSFWHTIRQGHLFFSDMTPAINLPDQYIILEYIREAHKETAPGRFYNTTTRRLKKLVTWRTTYVDLDNAVDFFRWVITWSDGSK